VVADLALDIGRHDTPGFAHGLGELRHRQFASGEIGTEGALALGAMAIPALRLGSCPQFHRLGMIATLRSRKIVARCKHDDGGKIFLHGGPPLNAALYRRSALPPVYRIQRFFEGTAERQEAARPACKPNRQRATVGVKSTMVREERMRLQRRQFLHLAAGAAAFSAVPQPATAQAYPSRPVT